MQYQFLEEDNRFAWTTMTQKPVQSLVKLSVTNRISFRLHREKFANRRNYSSKVVKPQRWSCRRAGLMFTGIDLVKMIQSVLVKKTRMLS